MCLLEYVSGEIKRERLREERLVRLYFLKQVRESWMICSCEHVQGIYRRSVHTEYTYNDWDSAEKRLITRVICQNFNV